MGISELQFSEIIASRKVLYISLAYRTAIWIGGTRDISLGSSGVGQRISEPVSAIPPRVVVIAASISKRFALTEDLDY